MRSIERYSLSIPAWLVSRCTCLFEIDDRGDDFDVVKRKLRCLCDHVTVSHDASTAIIVQAISITALLVCVDISASRLACGLQEQPKTEVELAKLVMRPRCIQYDLGPIECLMCVRRIRCE